MNGQWIQKFGQKLRKFAEKTPLPKQQPSHFRGLPPEWVDHAERADEVSW